MTTPPEQKRLDSKAPFEVLTPEILSSGQSSVDFKAVSRLDSLADYVSRTVLETLPNDLTRMIYLASLRDCNSGTYLHPELSQQKGVQAADVALRADHHRDFEGLLPLHPLDHVVQFHEH